MALLTKLRLLLLILNIDKRQNLLHRVTASYCNAVNDSQQQSHIN